MASSGTKLRTWEGGGHQKLVLSPECLPDPVPGPPVLPPERVIHCVDDHEFIFKNTVSGLCWGLEPLEISATMGKEGPVQKLEGPG